MICVVIKGPGFDDIRKQIADAIKYAQIIELRIDYFNAITQEEWIALKQEFSIPMIFTLRSADQGGVYDVSEAERLERILTLAELLPEYLDLESQVPSEFIIQFQIKFPSIKIILSYHDFQQTPENLDIIFDQMRQRPAFLYKIAVAANQSTDCMRFLTWAQSRNCSNLISISMGEFGSTSRCLSPIVGNPITYASVDSSLVTAPGQISAKALVNQYHHRTLNKKSQIFGLIGDPVDMSISDQTHNQLIKDIHLNAVYVKMALLPFELKPFLSHAKHLFNGLSVTMPLKEAIIPFIDEMDPYARQVGAVNTLLFENSKIYGFNTDGKGALDAIERKISVAAKTMVIIGTGGAAKAIAFEAIRRKANVIVLSRSAERAQLMAQCLGCKGESLSEFEICLEDGYDILINCTPVDRPIDERFIIPYSVVMDIRTRPKETLFIKEALKKQCTIVYGYEMFIEQAIGQFNIWFKNEVDYDKMRASLEKTTLETLGILEEVFI